MQSHQEANEAVFSPALVEPSLVIRVGEEMNESKSVEELCSELDAIPEDNREPRRFVWIKRNYC